MQQTDQKSLAGLPAQTPKVPEFEQSVRTLLQTFAVLVAIPITDYLRADPPAFSGAMFWLMFIVMISLLLRFIVGSAIHLTATYVGRKHPDTGEAIPPLSRSRSLFLKDIGFLILFGVLSTLISKSKLFDDFVFQSLLFIAAAALWCIVDISLIFILRLKDQPYPWGWLWLNLAQLILTGVLICPGSRTFLGLTDISVAVVLALIFAVVFVIDLAGAIGRFQVTEVKRTGT